MSHDHDSVAQASAPATSVSASVSTRDISSPRAISRATLTDVINSNSVFSGDDDVDEDEDDDVDTDFEKVSEFDSPVARVEYCHLRNSFLGTLSICYCIVANPMLQAYFNKGRCNLNNLYAVTILIFNNIVKYLIT